MNEETLVSILDAFYLLKDIEEKTDAEKIEIEVGYIRQPLLLFVMTVLNSNKEYFIEFCEFLESKAEETDNPHELTKINEFLELKPLIDFFKSSENNVSCEGGFNGS